MTFLTRPQLVEAVTALAKILDELEVDYAVMGGAAMCFLSNDVSRMTEDVDIVVHVDDRNITATRIHTWHKTHEPHGDRDLFCLVVRGCIDPTKDGYIFSDFMGISMVLWKRGVDGDQMGIDASSSIKRLCEILTSLRICIYK